LGLLLGPVLVESSLASPLIASSICLAFCWLSLTLAPKPLTPVTRDTTPSSLEVDEVMPHRTQLLWMSRLGLLSMWASMAIVRSQFALRFTQLGFRETSFGILVMVLGVTNFMMLTATGKWSHWHGKRSILCVSQLLGLVAMGLIAFGTTFPVFLLAMILLGAAMGFHYSSHLYYGTIGRTKRSTRMAIHELVIAFATALGSAPAGYLALYYGPLSPYGFGITLCALVLAIQLMLTSKRI
ncbi:MFS transporter, partial [Planctomycetota bacterium]